ncbi:hypothetical protein B0T16DRAFT_429600 [Cercophora newfieldiana]|uniref:Heterokaryon incompatibility domain-containing protein n=1 Tax=Cercophora newfieldiana TaxID=92897 RepID=A0AA39Y6I8_9PEZI|nr:hypothetical protein B0T16DRAFT_429600 [Cercophora newfieldiana]
MRLINAKTLTLHEFFSKPPPYAILSHTWGDEEVPFQNMQELARAAELQGFRKIQGCAREALSNGYGWIWIDTCCIDKTSSAELSAAINSMFAYPPREVEFFSAEWKNLGTRTGLEDFLSEKTGIPKAALAGESLSTFPVAERMSWASQRTTTQEEDMAYCLLGIFDVHMPLLYGEGSRAFVRLQEEILRRSEDLSVLLPGEDTDTSREARYVSGNPVCLDLFNSQAQYFTSGK